MTLKARGYIASGEFNNSRTPQHLQNQIVKAYCDANGLQFVLSRAEYWISGSTQCQLWAALREGFSHIVFFSLWQMPKDFSSRVKVYRHCILNGISLHFASERISLDLSIDSIADLEILIQTNYLLPDIDDGLYLRLLADFI